MIQKKTKARGNAADVLEKIVADVDSLPLSFEEKSVYLSGFTSGLESARSTMLSAGFDHWADALGSIGRLADVIHEFLSLAEETLNNDEP